MFKSLSVTLLVIGLCGGSVIPFQNVELSPLEARSDFWEKWGPGIMEFLGLLDVEKIMGVLVQYLKDPEVLGFLEFIVGPEFKNVVIEFESMEEFKEAYEYLASKGYNVETVIDFINSKLKIPPFEIPSKLYRNSKDMTGLLEDLIAVLPLDDMRKLFESKLQSNPELAELFNTINSEEFIDILKRMSRNPKFTEIKGIFEGHGFDFTALCTMAKAIFGDYFQGIFCVRM